MSCLGKAAALVVSLAVSEIIKIKEYYELGRQTRR